MRSRTSSSTCLGVWVCGALVLLAGLAEAQPPGGSPDARGLLIKMGEFLGKAPRLSTTVRSNYDTVQGSGQKIEWNEVGTLTLSRPDRLRVESEKSNGRRSLVVFDGKQISTYDETGRTYAQAPSPAASTRPSSTSCAIWACACRWPCSF